jgi:hypothetical protein
MDGRDLPDNREFPAIPGDGAAAGSAGVWYLLGAIVVAKLATIGVVLWLAWSGESGLWAAVTTWHWMVVGGALLAGPILFRLRLWRVRARRDELRRAEWMIDQATPDRSQNRPAGAH